MVVDGVGAIRKRLNDQYERALRDIDAAWAAGASQTEAMCAGALERARLTSILPSLPDNDWLEDEIRQHHGLPLLTRCHLDR